MFNDTTTDIKLFVGEADSLQLTIWLDGDYLIQESIDVTIHKGEISTPTLSADAGCVAFQNHCYQPVNVSYLDTSITINPITTQIVKIPMGTEESRLLTVGWSGLFLYPGENSFYVQKGNTESFYLNATAGAIEVQNNTEQNVTEVYVRYSDATQWGQNLLSAPISSGDFERWSFGATFYDVMVIGADGAVVTQDNLHVYNNAIARVTFGR
jgi:hypothetical protein